MADLGKLLLLVGGITVLLAVVLIAGGKIPGVGKLPGDVIIERDDFTFFFPLTTSILISLVLSVFFFIFRHPE